MRACLGRLLPHRAALWAALAMATLSGAASAEPRVTHATDHGWQLSDFHDSANPGCSIGTDGSLPGSRLVMGASRRHPAPMSLVLRKRGWAFRASTALILRAAFHDGSTMEFPARGQGQSVEVEIDSARLGAWISALTGVFTVELTLGPGEPPWTVSLNGAYEMVAAMGECLVAHDIEGVGPPFAGNLPARDPALFSKYPAPAPYRGPPVMPDFAGRDQHFSEYRTAIRNGIRQGADFAGHYRVIEIGCGTDCRFDYVADVSTGQVHAFPVSSGDVQMLRLDHRLSSELLRASWIPDLMNAERCEWQNFLLRDGRFVPLAPASSGTCPAEQGLPRRRVSFRRPPAPARRRPSRRRGCGEWCRRGP